MERLQYWNPRTGTWSTPKPTPAAAWGEGPLRKYPTHLALQTPVGIPGGRKPKRGPQRVLPAAPRRAPSVLHVGVGRALRVYFTESSLHGLHFIAETGRHWTERVFWLLCCLLSWYGALLLILSSYESFINNPISFGSDTSYLGWQVAFPSVSICQINNRRTTELLKEKFEPKIPSGMIELYEQLAFYTGPSAKVKNVCFRTFKKITLKPENRCPINNLSMEMNIIRTPCEELLQQCLWNGKKFDCCSYFQPLKTEIGTCFSINNLNTKGHAALNMTSSDRTRSPPNLTIVTTDNVKMMVQSPEDVPYFNAPTDQVVYAGLGDRQSVRFSVKELANDAGVQEAVDPALRRCLFASERPPPPFAAYSVGACVSTCRTQLQRDVCNCTFIDAPGAAPEEECDLWGVLCQVLKGELFTKLEPLWELDASKAQLVCDCPAGCEEVYINRVAESKNKVLDRSVGVTQLILDRLPTERFRRNLVKTPLDVVVSLGGTAGLFLGASILSIVELLYYLLLRPFGGDNDTNEDARISSKNSYDVRLRRPRLIPSRRPQGLLI